MILKAPAILTIPVINITVARKRPVTIFTDCGNIAGKIILPGAAKNKKERGAKIKLKADKGFIAVKWGTGCFKKLIFHCHPASTKSPVKRTIMVQPVDIRSNRCCNKVSGLGGLNKVSFRMAIDEF